MPDRSVEVAEPPVPDLADVVGNSEAVAALLVAAAGAHHVLMVGPPGAGKTMLATRLAGLLPDLDEAAALDATCIASLAGKNSPIQLCLTASMCHAIASAVPGAGSGISLRTSLPSSHPQLCE